MDKLPITRNGIKEDPTEPLIYENELQSITQETRSKLQILNRMATLIANIEEEESELKNELSNTILREEYEPLTERLVKLEEQYKVFSELNQELMDIKETGDIITHEKGISDRTPIENSINEEDSQRKALGNSINEPGTTHSTD